MSDDEVGALDPGSEYSPRRWNLGITGVAVGIGFVALVVTGLAARGTPTGTVEEFVVTAPPPAAAPVVAGPAVSQESAATVGAPTTDEDGASLAETTIATVEPPADPAQEQQVVNPLRVDPSWTARVSSATGIAARALEAYGNAVLALDAEDPGCRIGWPTLAGIGWIESGHGRAGLRDDGHPAAPIAGPALDGSPGRAAIRATAESSAWHGDPTWDHAVGPMQFIPSTWYRWGSDGDGDGVSDPQDIDDAALAAARYLCAGTRDLSTAEGWTAAVYSYNHSDAYVQKVFSTASGYATAVG